MVIKVQVLLQLKGPIGGQQAEGSGEFSKELEKVVIGQDEEQYFQLGS